MITRIIIAATILIGSASCTQEPEIAQYTVEEYRANDQLRRDVFDHCINDPGTLGQTADCINVREAERLESHGSLRGSAPVGLDAKRNPAYPESDDEPEVSVEVIAEPLAGDAN